MTSEERKKGEKVRTMVVDEEEELTFRIRRLREGNAHRALGGTHVPGEFE